MVWRKSVTPLKFLLNTVRIYVLSVALYYPLIKAVLKWSEIPAASFFSTLTLSFDSLPFSIKHYKSTLWPVYRMQKRHHKMLIAKAVFTAVVTSILQLPNCDLSHKREMVPLPCYPGLCHSRFTPGTPKGQGL